MLTMIVVLYMAIQFNLPDWCIAFVATGISINVLKFLCGIYKAGVNSEE